MSVVGRIGYKETAVGWIPEDWSVRKLNDMCSLITKGTTPTTLGFAYQPNGVNFIKVECVDSYGHIDLVKAAHIDVAAHSALKRSQLEDGDILYSIAGAIGRSAIVQKHHLPANTNQALALIRLSEKVNYEYVRLCLSSERQLSHITSISVSSAQANISLKDVASFELPIPPLPEQEKIAAILGAVDDKLDVIARQIAATNTLKRGLMQTLFSQGVGTQDTNGQWHPHTEFTTLSVGHYPTNWQVLTMGEVAPQIRRPVEIEQDALYPELGLRSHGKGSFHKPALTGAEVGGKRLFQIKSGDLLFSNVFAWEGAVAVAKPEDDGRFGSHRYITCAVEQSLADTSYLLRYLLSPKGIEQLQLASPGGAGRNKTLGLAALAAIKIPVPPLMEQQKITAILDGVDDKLTHLRTKQTHYQTLKRGLMQKLLTGEWRVKLA